MLFLKVGLICLRFCNDSNHFLQIFLSNFFEKVYIIIMKLTPILFISVLNIFLALVLLINNWKKNKSIIFLSLFLILFSISGITGSLLVDGGPVWLLALLLNNFAPLYYLYPVLLYFYVRTTVKDSIRLRKYDFLHFIPFVINLVAILPYLLTPFEYKYSVAQKVICNFEAYMQYDFKLFYPHFINQIFRPIQFFAYLVACIVLVIKFFPKIKASTGLLKSQFSFMFASLVFIVVFFLILSLNHFYVAIHQLINNDIHSTFLQSRKFIRLLSGFYFILPLFIMLNPRFLYGLPKKKDRKQEETQNIKSEFIAQNVVSETEKTLGGF